LILNKVLSFCKAQKTIHLYESEDCQWLSDGYAIYPLHGVPHFDTETICATYDIVGKKKEKIYARHFYELPARLSFESSVENESVCEINPIKVSINGVTYIQVLTSAGCEFIDGKYLTPLSDTNEDMLRIYERVAADGTTYFAVKEGLILIAIIMPALLLNEKTLEELKAFVTRCEVHMKNQRGKYE